MVSCEQRYSPVGGEVLEAGVLLRPEVLHGGLEGRVVAGHDVLLGLQGMLPLLPLPACAAYLGPPLAQRLLHPPVIPFTLFTTLQFGDLGSPVQHLASHEVDAKRHSLFPFLFYSLGHEFNCDSTNILAQNHRCMWSATSPPVRHHSK